MESSNFLVRSTHQEVFCKKDVPGNFTKILSEEKMSTENFVGEKFRHWKSNFPLLTDDFFFFFAWLFENID